MRSRFADDRRTKIEEHLGDIDLADLIEQKDVVVTISHEGYVAASRSDYRQQGAAAGIMASDSKDEDFIEHVFVSTRTTTCSCSRTRGVFTQKVYELPRCPARARGAPREPARTARGREGARS